jgi:hypothetical protein
MTWPLVRLEATGEELVLRPRLRLPGSLVKVLGPGHGRWVLPRADVVTVKPAIGKIARFNSGVEIFMRDGSLWIFWHGEPRRVVGALAALGYPVRDTQH